MATSISCDLCGEVIGQTVHAGGVELRANGHGVYAAVGQYHNTSEQPCWSEMVDRISMIHEVTMGLGFKPTPVVVPSPYDSDPKWMRYRTRKRQWERMSSEERGETLLNVLGEDALTGAEIADLLNDGLGVDKDEDDVSIVHTSDVRRLTHRLVRDGRLNAATETFRNHLRYRYARGSEAVSA